MIGESVTGVDTLDHFVDCHPCGLNIQREYLHRQHTRRGSLNPPAKSAVRKIGGRRTAKMIAPTDKEILVPTIIGDPHR